MKKYLLMLGIALLAVSLLSVPAARAYPLGCWYTGYSYNTYYYVCNHPWCEQGAGSDDDAEYVITHNEWKCPDGTTGYDTTTRFNQCLPVPWC